MQQRRLRLGDILDDYCPRERRVTNHAVVAMVDEDVKQTRCTTCDAEHEYKQARVPTLRRKKDSTSAAYKEVLATVVAEGRPAAPPVPAPARGDEVPEPSLPFAADAATPDSGPHATVAEPEPGGDGVAEGGVEDLGRVHRRLIRATLPRPENQQVVRPVPEFTMRQPAGRAGKFRPGGGRGPGQRPGPPGRQPGSNNGRAPIFSRPAAGSRPSQGGRPGGRNEMRPPRGGHGPRHGKKQSK
ncbi:MAG TPA: hypothetical protein VGK32_14805 [Vicinamibacterales bacterium]|jgi:hypothetical protein